MPTQNRIGCEPDAEPFELLSAKDLPFDDQSSALVIVEQDAFLAEFLLENCVFAAQIFNHMLLLAIDPAGKCCNQQMSRLQNYIHQRLGDKGKPKRSSRRVPK